MKREIKFRAWDNKFSRMYEYGEKCIGIHYDDWELQRLFENGDEAECAEIDGEIIILMQYTGLKDKHEKEIYEGDVFKLYHADSTYGDSYVVTYNEIHLQWYLGDNALCGMRVQDEEIIGNIYENPDLAK